jgi:DNA-binding beta-propeller fold protein YncE
MNHLKKNIRHIFFTPLTLFLTISLLLSIVAPSIALGKDDVRLKAILSQDQIQRPLAYPTALFFDTETDEAYVVDAGNNQLVLFDDSGFPTAAVGKGRGLDNIISGTYYNHRLYVCCSTTRQFPSGNITVLNDAFFLEQQLVLANKLPDPQNVVVKKIIATPDGKFYVLKSKNSDISIFDRHWNLLRHIAPRYDHLGVPEPAFIADMTQDRRGNLYFLSEQWGRVFVYNKAEKFLFSFGEKGGDRGKLARARGIAVDESKGRIYVSDYLRHTVLVYDITGRWLYEIGNKGSKPGDFFYPSAVGVNKQGLLFVADTFNHRVQIFTITEKTSDPGQSG